MYRGAGFGGWVHKSGITYIFHLRKHNGICLKKLGREKKRRGKQFQVIWVTEDEMVGEHHQFNGHELGQTPGDGEGQGDLVCCNPWSQNESDTTWRLNACPFTPWAARQEGPRQAQAPAAPVACLRSPGPLQKWVARLSVSLTPAVCTTQPKLQVHHFSWGSPKENWDLFPHGQEAVALGLEISKVPSSGFRRGIFITLHFYPRHDFTPWPWNLTRLLHVSVMGHITQFWTLQDANYIPAAVFRMEKDRERKQERGCHMGWSGRRQ